MVDLNVDIDSKALRKLMSVAASGVGAVAGAWLAKRNAKSDASVKLIGAQAERNAQAILNGEKMLDEDGRLIDLTSNTLPYINQDAEIKARLDFQEQKRQNNLQSVTTGAIEYLSEDVSAEEVDPDWIAKFFTNVQDITSKEAQKYWSKILAQEVNTPGKVSLRTLDVLKNIKSSEAQKFELITPYIWGDFIPKKEDFFNKKNIPYSMIILLEEAGLLYSGFGLRKTFTSLRKDIYQVTVKLDNSEVLIIEGSDTNFVLEVPCFMLTSSGIELLDIINRKPIDKDFVSTVLVANKDKNLRFTYGQLLEDGSAKYSKTAFIKLEELAEP